VNDSSRSVFLPTRQLDPDFVQLLRSLRPGDRIRLIQTVRVGSRKWESRVEGIFREIAYLETGITTERVKEDSVVVPLVRFTKPNGELSSISLDEHSRVERV